MITYINKRIPKQPPEKDYGNKEYKRYLINHHKINPERFIEKRATQMLFRLIEGDGKALYLFGIEDNGEIRGMNKNQLKGTISNLKKISKSIKANIKSFRIYTGGKGYVCTARIQLPYDIFTNIINTINFTF